MSNRYRKLETKRDLVERWINLMIEMQETGKLITILEVEDDKTTAIRIKKKCFKHAEDIKQFYREVIEPIRASIERY